MTARIPTALLVILLAAVVTALAAAGAAGARDNPPTDVNGKKSCALKTSKDGTTWLPHDTTITITMPDGSQHKARCTDGVWQLERPAPVVSVTGHASFGSIAYGLVTLQVQR